MRCSGCRSGGGGTKMAFARIGVPARTSSTMLASSTAADAPRDPYAALRVPAYRRFLIGNTATNVGRQALDLAAAWQVYRWTDSPTALGLVGLANFLPYVVFALQAGHLADNVSRRRLIQTTLAGSALVSVLLAVISQWPGVVGDWAPLRWFNAGVLGIARFFEGAHKVNAAGFEQAAVAAVFILLLLGATIRTLGAPARASLVPLILPREKLANAITWGSTTFELTAMAGPALAGALLQRFASADPLLAAAGVCALLSLILIVAASAAGKG